MNINNNYSGNSSFTSLKISKNTKKIMEMRGELDEFNKFLPDLQRKAKAADITVYAVNRMFDMPPKSAYGISIRPINPIKNNILTKFLGLSKNKIGDSYIEINSGRASEHTFRALYEDAYKARLG